MKPEATVLLIALAAIGCAKETPDVSIRKRLLKIAGDRAIDCGRATTKDQYAQLTACVLDAFHRKSPFLVQYKVMGIDAEVEEGLAFDSNGKLSSVDTISRSPLYGGHPSGKIDVRACDANALRTLNDGVLTC